MPSFGFGRGEEPSQFINHDATSNRTHDGDTISPASVEAQTLDLDEFRVPVATDPFAP